MTDVRQLEPKSVWNCFEDLNAVPRPSKREEKVIAFMEQFLQKHKLDYTVDKVGNIIARKPATPGMENRRMVVMQAHVDMVHQKNANTVFDFETQGIKSYIDGEWVKAKGTTLGADNGMGVAAIMAVLASTDIAHPALEALFTIDEESGMTGAHELSPDALKGEILLNLDTEEDDELSIGCAGGIDINIEWKGSMQAVPKDAEGIQLRISGLKGGHSGMDIIHGQGNANKILTRFMLEGLSSGLHIGSIDSGGLRNAIPREGSAHLAVSKTDWSKLEERWNELRNSILDEFKTTDPQLKIEWSSSELPSEVLEASDRDKLTYALQATYDGLARLSPDVEDLVETSNNLAQVVLANGTLKVKCLTRSDRESAKYNMAHAVAAPWELIGAEVVMDGSYPGWKLDPQAPMLEMMKNLYRELFDGEPQVMACHAGLECGLIGKHYPNLEMISFGPTIRGAHSPDERVHIASVQKFWHYLKEALKRIPEKA